MICSGLFKPEFVFEFVGGHEEGVWSGADGDVDGGGDVASLKFGGFADVCSSRNQLGYLVEDKEVGDGSERLAGDS